MAICDMYELFKGRVNDPKRSREKHITPLHNGPKAPPAGTYWVAYEPDYRRADRKAMLSYGDALSNLRPALLDTDSEHLDSKADVFNVSPTEYAKRWGLHEDGPPGRSRTSLTRSDTRTFRKGDLRQPVRGKWLAEYFEKKALQENMDLRDWLEHSLPRTALKEDDKVYLDWLDDLLRDEMWQGMLFNDFTMDELHEDDIFTMRDTIPKCDIRGSIHPQVANPALTPQPHNAKFLCAGLLTTSFYFRILAQDNWIAPAADSGFGRSPSEPRWYYKIGDKEGEYDPRNNNEVWDAMRPALLLVSRILKERPEYLNAILRIWDHKVLPLHRDTRPDKAGSLKTFDTVPSSPDDPAVCPETQFLRPVGEKYVAALWKVLARDLRLHIHGNMPACGMTTVSLHDVAEGESKAPKVFIALNANLLFPLLVPGYSASEKIMANFWLACVILHELAHAFCFIGSIALRQPDILPRSVAPQRDYPKFNLARRAYLGKTRSEPYFRHEPVSELGFSFENWLFGGAPCPLTHTNHRHAAPGLSWQSVALHSERFPFYRCLDSGGIDINMFRYGGAILDFPVYDSESVFVNCPVNAVLPYFRQDFWMNPVKIYGLKALKMHAADHKMKATMSLFENKSSHCHKFYEGMQHVRGHIDKVIEALRGNGFTVACNYLNVLMVERIRLPIAVIRWTTQASCFKARGERAARHLWKAYTIALESQIYNAYLNLRAKNSPEHKMRAFAAQSYRRWMRHVSYLPGRQPPKGSEALTVNGPEGFIRELEEVVEQSGCQRYLACIPDVFMYLSQELQQMEQAVFESYMMDEHEMQHMLSRFQGPWIINLDFLTKIARSFVNQLSLFQGQQPDIGTWMTRFLEITSQYTTLKQYLTTDRKKLNPVTWRHMFLSIGKGNAARRTPSKNWANLVREQLVKMPLGLRAHFERVVHLVMAYSGTKPPHWVAKSLREQCSGSEPGPDAPGAFMDLVHDLEVDPEQVAAENLMRLAQEPGFNPDDGRSLVAIVQEVCEQVARRRETRDEIQGLQGELNGIQQTHQDNSEAHQTQEALLHAQQRREELERQIAGLQQLQLQHHQLQNYDEIHAELNVLQDVLEELLDEVNLRELHAEQAQGGAAVAEEREWEQRLLEAEIQKLREIERQHEEQMVARVAGEQRERHAQEAGVGQQTFPTMFRARFPPSLEEGMLPVDLAKRKRGPTDEDGPEAKRPRFRAETLRTLIEDPPFIGGPVRIAGRPLPFTRCEQLAMPYGGLPEVRYEVEPLKVRGEAAINIVERVADAAERWGEMGVRQRYEVPWGAVEALAAVAGSERSGLPGEMEWE